MSLVSRYPQWALILLAAALYGPAFLLPATLGRDGSGGMSGASAYGWAWTLRDYRWVANGLAWAAAALLALRLWPWATVAGLGAFGVAVSSSIRAVVLALPTTHGAGYWLWTASTGVLAIGALIGWRAVPADRRLSP